VLPGLTAALPTASLRGQTSPAPICCGPVGFCPHIHDPADKGRNAPIPDSCAATNIILFNYLVGDGKQRVERLGSPDPTKGAAASAAKRSAKGRCIRGQGAARGGWRSGPTKRRHIPTMNSWDGSERAGPA
jgi:hypothetical protein